MSKVIMHKNSPEFKSRAVEVIGLLDPRKSWVMEIKPYTKKRNLDQNARYWKLMQLAASEYGCSAKAFSEDVICPEFFGTMTIEIGGKKREVRRQGTSGISVKEFSKLIEFAQNFCMQNMGIWL